MGDLLGSPRVAPLLFSSFRSPRCFYFPLPFFFPAKLVSYLNRFRAALLSGAIIPALMHRIPSELRSYACLGESSTRMGDLLGSPCVAPLLFLLFGPLAVSISIFFSRVLFFPLS